MSRSDPRYYAPLGCGEPKSEDETEADRFARLISGSPTPAPVEASLEDAVKAAPPDTVQRVLLEVCRQSEEARHIATGQLLTALAPSAQGRKRKRYEMCKHCGQEYDVERNEKGDCVYHSGERVCDYDNDLFCDFETWRDGEPSDYASDSEYAEAFVWSCCKEEGNARGCIASRHKPADYPEGAKKLKPVLSSA